MKRELEEERSKTLTELGQLEQKARRDEIEKESFQRRDHANFAPNSREKKLKFPENFGAPRSQSFRDSG